MSLRLDSGTLVDSEAWGESRGDMENEKEGYES